MRRFVALAVLVGGCSFYGVTTERRVAPDRVECHADIGVPIIDTLVAVGGIGSAIALASGAEDEGPLSAYIDRTGATLAAAVGGVAVISAIYGYGAVSSCERAEQAARTEQLALRERARAREQARAAAWHATKQAAAAARAGDCATVAKLDTDVYAVDAELHDVVFLGDVAIRRCLGR